MQQKSKVSSTATHQHTGTACSTDATPRRTSRLTWKQELADILKDNNDQHAYRHKVVSDRTKKARSDDLYRIFTLLRKMGFRLQLRGLAPHHIEALMRYWTVDPGVADELAKRGAQAHLQLRAHALSAAHIQGQLSVLRTFCSWIGKAGMVRDAKHYMTPDRCHLVSRKSAAEGDKSWHAAGADFDAVYAKVRARCIYVATQLEVMMVFGLRRKEAVMFSPRLAVVPGFALPAQTTELNSFVSFLQIKRGTKGGRLRYTAIRNDQQRNAIRRATLLAVGKNGHIGVPGKSLKQSLDHFSNVLRAAGVSLRDLGVTPHGLRHEFAGNLFFELADIAAPIRGGHADEVDRLRMEQAYLEVARQLGHNRPAISGAYLGAKTDLFRQQEE